MTLNVLVVDDATFVRDTIKRNLRPLIPDVVLYDAIDGRKAMSVMKTKKIDLILSDWEMPEVSGEEFLKWLRADEAYKHIPFVMVTSRGDRDHVVSAVQAGVSDYLTKPFTPEELHKKVSKQLKRMGYKRPRGSAPAPAAEASSLSLLTGGQDAKPKKAAAKKPAAVEAASGFGKPAASPPAKKKDGAAYKSKAQLRFSTGVSDCVVREMSLQAMNGVIARPEKIPTVFDQAAADLFDTNGEALARLNGYVHSVSSIDQNPSSKRLKVIIRFVDNDPEKFEALSKFIASR